MTHWKRYLLLCLLLAGNTSWAGSVWIDVRTQPEYDTGHVAGALLMPHDRIGAMIESAVPDHDTEIHLYCHSGRRAGLALQTLRSMGYLHVINEGGYEQARQVAACQQPDATGHTSGC